MYFYNYIEKVYRHKSSILEDVIAMEKLMIQN